MTNIIGQNPFGQCVNLTTILVDEGNPKYTGTSTNDMIIDKQTNTVIAAAAVESIVIPNYVTDIAQNAFIYCSTLKTITFSSELKTIGQSAFWMCESLTSISLPGKLTGIAQEAFKFCKQLKTISFAGTKTQWNAVNSGNIAAFESGAVVTCTDGTITIS